jgi:hypothetical protein
LKPPTRALVAGGALGVALITFAFVAAPKSCQWGYDAYFWTGVVCLIILFALPFAFRVGQSILGRAGLGVGFAIFGGGVWLAGVFAANFRIICALF